MSTEPLPNLTTRERIELYYKLCEQGARQSIGRFLDRVLIDSKPEPAPFGDKAEPWQREIVRPIANAIEGLAGLRDYDGPRSFFICQARGHDKSSNLARIIAWSLCFSPKRFEIALCAADKDQAALVARAMEDQCRLNPWIADKIEFQRNKIVGPSGIADIMTSDAGSAFGGRHNLILLDEITNWPNREAFWAAMVSGRAKIPGSILVILTNAGTLGTWQHKAYLEAKSDPKNWFVFDRPGKLASWISDEDWEVGRRMLPATEAKRILQNIWIDPAEESGYLTSTEVQACMNTGTLRPIPPGAQCIASIDYGAVNDRTAMTIVYQDENGAIQVPILECIQGAPGRPVQLSEVEAWIEETYKTYKWKVCFVDPHQTEGTIQKYQKLRYPIERVDFRGGAFNCDIATNLRTLIINRKISWHPMVGKDFAGELIGLVTKITPHGYRFENASGRHDDQAFAVAVAAIESVKRPYIQPITYVPPFTMDVGNPMDLFGPPQVRKSWDRS